MFQLLSERSQSNDSNKFRWSKLSWDVQAFESYRGMAIIVVNHYYYVFSGYEARDGDELESGPPPTKVSTCQRMNLRTGEIEKLMDIPSPVSSSGIHHDQTSNKIYIFGISLAQMRSSPHPRGVSQRCMYA
jgi:hypothetical protein